MGESPYAVPAGMTGPALIVDAYDSYADELYAYCRFLVGNDADAMDALEDTFLVLAARLATPPPDAVPSHAPLVTAQPGGGLPWEALPRDGRLRSWLFAVARNECLRSVKSRRTAPGPGAQPAAVPAGEGSLELLTAAVEGLAPGERDLIAMLLHGLEIDDIAEVLGIGRDDAFTLLSQALGQLEAATAALLVARSARGRRGCAGLNAVLGDWDGRLTVPRTRKLTQHIERCRSCSARRQGELRAGLLLGLTPGALLGAAVTAEALRPAAGMIGRYRDQVLSVACDPSAEGDEARGRVYRRAYPFGENGFPKPLPADTGRRVPRSRIVVGVAAVAAVAVAATVALTAEHGRSHDPDAGAAAMNRHSASAVNVNALPSTAAPTSASPSPTPSRTPPASPSPSPTPPPSPSFSPSPPPPKPAPTISVPSSVALQWNGGDWELQGTLPVTVTGGSLAWSISNPNRGLRLSQSSGTSSASVRISGRPRQGMEPLTVTAGGKSFTVVLTMGG